MDNTRVLQVEPVEEVADLPGGPEHARGGRVHRLATLATIQAGQGDAEAAAGTAVVMLDQAAGMESRRIHDRIIRVRDAVASVSDGRAAAGLAERVADMTAIPVRQR